MERPEPTQAPPTAPNPKGAGPGVVKGITGAISSLGWETWLGIGGASIVIIWGLIRGRNQGSAASSGSTALGLPLADTTSPSALAAYQQGGIQGGANPYGSGSSSTWNGGISQPYVGVPAIPSATATDVYNASASTNSILSSIANTLASLPAQITQSIQPLIQPQAPAPSNPAPSAPIPVPQSVAQHTASNAFNYTVYSGDTLSAIGQRFGQSWQAILQSNADVINRTAAMHGAPGNGNYIYPGEIIRIH